MKGYYKMGHNPNLVDWHLTAKHLADAITTDHEIISECIKDLLPKGIHADMFKAINTCINNKGIRQRAFNSAQMRKQGLSRIS